MPPLVLSDDEVQQLKSIANSRSLPHSIMQRAPIVLACVAGEPPATKEGAPTDRGNSK